MRERKVNFDEGREGFLLLKQLVESAVGRGGGNECEECRSSSSNKLI